jgi:5'(3')-deoxyribonucleotidase
MTDRSFVFGVDLDGVVADFYGGLRPIAAEWLGVAIESLTPRVSWGLVEWGVDQAPGGYERLHRFAVTQRELFLKMPPMPGAPQALRRLSIEGVRIRIITHRLFIKYFHQVAVSQTIQWLDRHDIPYWDLCFMQQKTAVGADLYIEDSPANIERLRAEGAQTIVFTNSTNEHLAGPRADTWDEVLRLVLAEKAAWQRQASPLP